MNPQTPPQMPTLSTFDGTPEGWRTGVAAHAVGNPMLAVALCASFAAPLVSLFEPLAREGFGVRFVSPSGAGKTTLLALAASVWIGDMGAPELLDSGLLVADQAGDEVIAPKDLPGYMALSAGEQGASNWQNLPALRTHGVFDELHGHANGAALSAALLSAAQANNGHAGPVFLAAMAMRPQPLRDKLNAFQKLMEFSSARATDGQDGKARATPAALRREAHRFALLALAGEMASAWGLTGWPKGEAVRACATALRVCQAGQAGQGARHE